VILGGKRCVWGERVRENGGGKDDKESVVEEEQFRGWEGEWIGKRGGTVN